MRTGACAMSSRTAGRARGFAVAALALSRAGAGAAARRGRRTHRPGTRTRSSSTHGYSTYGDLKYPADFAHFDYVNPDAPKGGEISHLDPGHLRQLQPLHPQGPRRRAVDHRLRIDADLGRRRDSGQYCLLCESLEYTETEDWVIFHMRHDITFSDGTPMTAADVVFSHFKLLDEGLPSYAEAVRALIPEAEALDDYTVKFTFADGVPRKDLISQAGGVPVFSKAWFERTGAKLSEPHDGDLAGLGSLHAGQLRDQPAHHLQAQPRLLGQGSADERRPQQLRHHPHRVFLGHRCSDGGVQGRGLHVPGREFLAELGDPLRLPGDRQGLDQVKDTPRDGTLPCGGLHVQPAPSRNCRTCGVRQAMGLVFNRDWTNKTLQYGLFEQRVSFWQEPS